MRTFALLLTCLTIAARLAGQLSETPRLAQPMPMPSDRAEDSYAIYSQLLKRGPIEWRDVERQQWLIEDTTNAVRLDVDCGAENTEMSPRGAVKAPEDRQAEWNEVLADYDQHCHDVIELDRDSFRTELPVRLLNAEDRRRFNPQRPSAEFANGAGLHQFTQIFFNASHTLAAVREGMWCGPRCGNWMWVVLERRQGRWEMLPWVYSATFS
ncbi:MAG: hypothetical protein WBX19_22330 [Terracidiphilus sp.]